MLPKSDWCLIALIVCGAVAVACLVASIVVNVTALVGGA